MNAVSHARRPRASSCAIKVRQRRSQVPSSNQRRKRRQHVAGLGYSAGRSRQRAPVFSTHKIPSTTARLSAHGRPPRVVRGKRGSSGSILAHCASVNRTPRLATSATSGQFVNAAEKKYKYEILDLTGYETGSRHFGALDHYSGRAPSVMREGPR
jgi:hypothetical protein